MSGLLEFMAQFGTEDRCIEHLAGLRWPGGYVCASCGGPEAWRLKERPRIYECRGCGHQESVTAGTIFHRTRTDLPKWFLAPYLILVAAIILWNTKYLEVAYTELRR